MAKLREMSACSRSRCSINQTQEEAEGTLIASWKPGWSTLGSRTSLRSRTGIENGVLNLWAMVPDAGWIGARSWFMGYPVDVVHPSML